MTEGHWNRVQEIFDRVVAGARGERSVLLDQACGDDPALRAEVESLLEQENRIDDDFLRPPAPLNVPGAGEPEAALPAGTRIGRYSIEAVIAAGGMGTVYRAVQDQPRRMVALKLMKRNVASRAALRRFQLEADLLGNLRHPNVAQVFEAGMHVHDGGCVPYFAMEYIPDATSITQFAADDHLDTRQRLKLFAKVCDAVHHGHQKGIIHRDLKPANILVGGDRQPQVIDFGVARATDSDLAAATLQTDAGQLIGTLQYMSPEQCDAGATDIDTRSDVYSLGVVLYELLCGTLPYDVSDTTIVGAARVIAERAPRPPSEFDAKLRGDVESILLMALAKDREQRYPSGGEFAADIRRHLNHEPMVARPLTTWQRMARWIARRPIAATAAAGVTVAALSVLATFFAVWWVNARPYDVKLQKNDGLSYLPNGYAARLISRSGRILHEWPKDASTQSDGVGIGRMVERPAKLGGGRVAVLGFQDSSSSPHSGALVVFDVEGDRDKPLWSRRITTDDVLPELLDRQYTGDDFGFIIGQVADVFPERERPGPEIIAVFAHTRNSQRILRIYSLAGDLLYQVWHDGTLGSVQWLSGAGLLVLTGDYHRPFWTPAGELKGTRVRVRVAFALRPKVGAFGTDFLDPIAGGDGSDPLRPAWFNVLEPLDSADHMRYLSAHTRKSPLNSPSRVIVTGMFGDSRHTVAWVLDDLGRILPGSPSVSDEYRQNRKLPFDHRSKLDLPPWRALEFVPFDASKHTAFASTQPTDDESDAPSRALPGS